MGGHGGLQPTKYHSIDEIPDSLIPTYSKRDPDNQVYRTRRWVNFKKEQILYQQRDGVPNYLRTPFKRNLYYGTWVFTFGLLFANLYTLNKMAGQKKK